MSKPTKKLRVLAFGPETAIEIPLPSLTAIGGAKSTGIVVPGLKQEGDYAVLAPAAESVSLHPLRGTKNRATSLDAGSVFRVEDLAIFVEEVAVASPTAVPGVDAVSQRLPALLSDLALHRGSEKPLADILAMMTELCDHDHGLIASETVEGRYEVLATKNLESSEAWLSETLVQEAISRKVPVLLQNVLGSDFDTQRSLMATKFLSVFCWPLVVQGQTRGVLITASRRPQAGRIEAVRRSAETFANLAALILDFRLRELRLRQEISIAKGQLADRPFLTASPSVIEVCDLARKLAPSPLSILIQGETGVGKEVLSRWIHQQSDRKHGPFVAVNCAAIPAELLESTLFGHKRGAFTGAVADHVGKIQQANGGTLFLDEIGDLALPLQAKLLRVLQDGIVEPVGASKPVETNIRLICASHKNIRKISQTPDFRDDLYYRIAQATLTIPALRERFADVRLLAREFLREIDPALALGDEATTYLLAQKWPGNIRELKSAIQRAAVLAGGTTLLPAHFSAGTDPADRVPLDSVAGPSWLGAEDLESAKHRFVREKIAQALAVTEGNKTRAAELLGVTSRTLFRYLEPRTETNLS